MGALTPRAPTETTSLCGPRIDEIVMDEPTSRGKIFYNGFDDVLASIELIY